MKEFLLAALGLHGCMQAFSSCSQRGLPSSCGMRASLGGFSFVERGFSGAQTSAAVVCGLSSFRSWAQEHGPKSGGTWA